jgi:hypothetical protein
MRKYTTPYGTIIIINSNYILEKTYYSLEALINKQDKLFKKIKDLSFKIKDYKMFISSPNHKKQKYTIRIDLEYLL